MTQTDNQQQLFRLTIEDKEIILVGTAHVSKESVELVESVINAEHPDTVCVELCPSRYQSISQKEQWREMDIVKVIAVNGQSNGDVAAILTTFGTAGLILRQNDRIIIPSELAGRSSYFFLFNQQFPGRKLHINI